MNNYKFRGKRVNTNNGRLTEFVYGYYYEHEPPLQCCSNPSDTIEQSKHYILKTGFADWNMTRNVDFTEVIPGTIGQWTVLNDSEDCEVYTDDIIYAEQFKPSYYTIKFIEGGYCANYKKQFMPLDINHFYDSRGCMFKVIGNVHDNKDLVEKHNL